MRVPVIRLFSIRTIVTDTVCRGRYRGSVREEAAGSLSLGGFVCMVQEGLSFSDLSKRRVASAAPTKLAVQWEVEMIDLLVLAAMLLAALGLGRPGARLIGLRMVGRLEALIFETALGLVGLSMSLFILGLLGWLRAGPVWGLILALAALGIWLLYEELRSNTQPRFKLPTLDRLEWLVLLPTGALFLFTLLLALAPTTGTGGDGSWDGLSYHLTIPKIFIEQGRIVSIPFMPITSNYPLGLQMLYVPGLMLGRTAAAQLLHFSMGLLTALAMAALAARYANWAVALLSPALFLAIPLVRHEATWPSNDLGVVLYTFLALLALINWQKIEHKPWLVLAGIMAGFACSIKLTAVFAVAPLGVVLWGLVLAKRPRRLSDWMAPSLTFGIPLLLFGSPWYIKNYVTVGNPFMPFLYGLFGGANWSAEAAERWRLYLEAFGLRSLGLAGFQVPFFILPAISVGCLLVIGFVALKKYMPVTKILLGYTLLYLALWLVAGSVTPRYALSIYPVATLLVVWFVSTFIWRSAVLRPVFYGVVALGVVIFAMPGGGARFLVQDTLPVVVGLESQENYLSRKLDSYTAYQFANAQLPDSAKFFIFPDNRTYYLNRSYIWGCPYLQAIIDYDRYDSSSDLLHELRGLGITHIIVHRPIYPHYRQLAGHEPQLIAYVDHAMRLVEGLNSLGLSEVFEANGVTIYALSDTPQAQPDNP